MNRTLNIGFSPTKVLDLKPVGLDEHAQVGIVGAGVQILETGIYVIPLADPAFGLIGGVDDSTLPEIPLWWKNNAFKREQNSAG